MNVSSRVANNVSLTIKRRQANRSWVLGCALLAMAMLLAGASFSLAGEQKAAHRDRVHLAADGAVRPSATKPPGVVDQSDASSERIVAVVDRTIKVFIETTQAVSAPVWDGAFWLSNQILGMLADSGLDPSVATNGIQLSAGSGRAASAIALGLIGVFLAGLAGPLYYSWKMWRVRHVRQYR